MLLLGGGCPQLTQLHAEFDLRGMPESAAARMPASFVEPVNIHELQQALLLRESTRKQQQQRELDVLQQRRVGLSSVMQQALLLCESTRQQQWQQQQQQQLDVLQQRFGAAGTGSASSSGWPPLAHVSITGGCSMSNLANLLESCPQLQQLCLDGLGPLGDGIATILADRGQQLKVLQISGCSSMTAGGCSVLAIWLQQLQQLDLVDVGLPADHLGVLLQQLGGGFRMQLDAAGNANSSSRRLSHLRQLKIERCRGMTNDVITTSLTRLQQLQQLQLVACDNIQGDSALLSLVELLPQLAVLEVVGCKGVADPGFARRWEAAAAVRVRHEPGCRAAVQRVVWQA
jgi:hypothetical protein